jgi:hypothetical protein
MADVADGLLARARGIRQGLETEVALAVDVMVPSRTMAGVLRDFQEAFPWLLAMHHAAPKEVADIP